MDNNRRNYDPDLLRYYPDLEQDIRDCLRQMEYNEAYFNQETEPELIEQRIYEREALQSRYNYLMRQARALGIKVAP